ncbi:MAG: prepilin peptidase [Candidatus Sericytochromatia bacterium]|nr:prepilin peptidase [Candidatus Sericytochromatia bacterium]
MLSVLSPEFLYLFVALFGLVIGSFLNVVIFRTPAILLADCTEEELEEEQSIPDAFFARVVWALRYVLSDIWFSVAYCFKDFWQESVLVLKGIAFPASHCGHCQQPVRWYDNLPVLSWFWLRGKCRHCQQAFSFRYPLIEALTASLFCYAFWLTGMSPELPLSLFLVAVLWTIFWIDLDTQFIFNVMTYPSILIAILYNAYQGTLFLALATGLGVWALFELIMLLSIIFLRKEGMGGGDVKLAILLGIWLGPSKLVVALALAFTLGALAGLGLLLVSRQSKPFPFGPFLVLGALVSWGVGDGVWTWYINKSIS